jgi:hypothetical protein
MKNILNLIRYPVPINWDDVELDEYPKSIYKEYVKRGLVYHDIYLKVIQDIGLGYDERTPLKKVLYSKYREILVEVILEYEE